MEIGTPVAVFMNNNTTLKASRGQGALFERGNSGSLQDLSRAPAEGFQLNIYFLGIVAKAMIAPIGIGVVCGLWLDYMLSLQYDWMSAGIVLGFVFGSLSARRRLIREEAMLREEDDWD